MLLHAAANFNLKDNDEPISEQYLQDPGSVQSVDDDGEPVIEGQQEAQFPCVSSWPVCTGSCAGGGHCHRNLVTSLSFC